MKEVNKFTLRSKVFELEVISPPGCIERLSVDNPYDDFVVRIKGFVDLEYEHSIGEQWINLKAFGTIVVTDKEAEEEEETSHRLVEIESEIPARYISEEDKRFIVSKVFKLLTTIAYIILGEKGEGYEFSLEKGYWKVVGDSQLVNQILPLVYTVTAILSKLGYRCRVWKGKKSIRVNFKHYPSFLYDARKPPALVGG